MCQVVVLSVSSSGFESSCTGWIFTVSLCPQIQEGMVVYVCFFHGANEDVTLEMGKVSFSLCSRHCVIQSDATLRLKFLRKQVILI